LHSGAHKSETSPSLLQDVLQCEDFPGYLSPNLSSTNNQDFNGFISYSSEVGRLAQVKATAVSGSEHNTTHLRAVQEAAENGSYTQTPQARAEDSRKFSVFVGILTTAKAIARRQEVRLAYSVQTSHQANFTIRFVLGAL
jgi:hypothetical protein